MSEVFILKADNNRFFRYIVRDDADEGDVGDVVICSWENFYYKNVGNYTIEKAREHWINCSWLGYTRDFNVK